jgi:outer membrane protein assembly factor BamB
LLCLNYLTDKRDGEKVWSHQFDDKGVWSSQNKEGNYWGVKGMPLIFKGGSKRWVGISDNQYIFHAFDRKTGDLAWSVSLLPEGEKAFSIGASGAAYDGNVIYTAANSLSNSSFSIQSFIKPLTKEKEANLLDALTRQVKSTITALKAKTGSILWQKSFDSAVLGTPSVANNLVFVGFFNGYFRVLEAKTGKMLFEFRTGPTSGEYGLPPHNLSIPLTSTPVISNGKVFIGGGYAFPQDSTKVISGGLFVFETPIKENDQM